MIWPSLADLRALFPWVLWGAGAFLAALVFRRPKLSLAAGLIAAAALALVLLEAYTSEIRSLPPFPPTLSTDWVMYGILGAAGLGFLEGLVVSLRGEPLGALGLLPRLLLLAAFLWEITASPRGSMWTASGTFFRLSLMAGVILSFWVVVEVLARRLRPALVLLAVGALSGLSSQTTLLYGSASLALLLAVLGGSQILAGLLGLPLGRHSMARGPLFVALFALAALAVDGQLYLLDPPPLSFQLLLALAPAPLLLLIPWRGRAAGSRRRICGLLLFLLLLGGAVAAAQQQAPHDTGDGDAGLESLYRDG